MNKVQIQNRISSIKVSLEYLADELLNPKPDLPEVTCRSNSVISQVENLIFLFARELQL